MNFTLCRKFGFVLLVSTMVLFARGNRGYGFLMLEEPISPRVTAMGTAGTALGGAGFLYYNPAQLFFSQLPLVSLEFGQMPGGVTRGGLESSVLFSKYFMGLGIYSSALDFETRDEHGFGSSVANNTTMGALNAGLLRERYALAVNFNGVQDRIGHFSTMYALSMSGGVALKVIPGRLNMGISGFHGIGVSKGFLNSDSTWQKGQIPRWARIGAAWKDTLNSLPYTVALDAVYRDEDGSMTFPLGVEVEVLPSVSLRMGKRLGMETEMISLGLGLDIDNISFDAAFVPVELVDDYDTKWSMAFTYSLGSSCADDSVRKQTSASVSGKTETEVKESPQVQAIEEVDKPQGESDTEPADTAGTDESQQQNEKPENEKSQGDEESSADSSEDDEHLDIQQIREARERESDSEE